MSPLTFSDLRRVAARRQRAQRAEGFRDNTAECFRDNTIAVRTSVEADALHPEAKRESMLPSRRRQLPLEAPPCRVCRPQHSRAYSPSFGAFISSATRYFRRLIVRLNTSTSSSEA